jgi:hypothetical protein
MIVISDCGESVDASLFNDIFKGKDITVHIYACSQKNAKWEGKFDLVDQLRAVYMLMNYYVKNIKLAYLH